MSANRKYKDRLFRFIFGNEKNKEWALSLYNAINKTSYTCVDDMVITTIDDALYMGMKNDVSFLIADTLNLFEQQSSYNPNMPLRYLIYAAMVYSSFIKTKPINLYSPYLQKIPAPRCICFYNGKSEIGDEREEKLSDAFINNEKGDIEVKARMININYGRNKELLEGCKPLGEYSWFIAQIRKNQEEGLFLIDAINNALEEMPNHFVIKPFLLAHKAEVENMCITEYNEAETLNLLSAECEARGEARGKAKGKTEGIIETLVKLLKKGLISESSAAETAGMTIEDFRKYEDLHCS